jgi:prepilin-type N-terminal cleavage/methylation domain-containing protein
MIIRFHTLNQKGFTLIELISIMIIMAVMAAVAVEKLDLLSGTATGSVLQEAVKELNTREHLIWIDIKLSSSNWVNDEGVFAEMDTNLGPDYAWIAGPNASGGTLQFRSQSIALIRTPSTNKSSATWK